MVETNTTNALLDPVQLGPYLLRNRLVVPPLTRSRTGAGECATELTAVYYAQRASAGLIITEGSQISAEGQGFPWTPGIHTPEQVRAWRTVVDAVHHRGGRIFLQLWHVGRQSHSTLHGGINRAVAPSPIKADGKIFTVDGTLEPFETPRALEIEEIPARVGDFAEAARNAHRAGFDGVEVHGASGYLIDQFLNDSSNTRTDAYGGTIENRTRFLLEVVDAVVGVWGPGRVGVRLSPSSPYGDMLSADKKAIYSAAVTALNRWPLAYLHLVEPNVSGSETIEADTVIPSTHFREIYEGTLILAGNHTPESGHTAVKEGTADLIGFGRGFIANPDLAERIRAGAEIREPDRAYYYGGSERGYTDYPSLTDEARYQAVLKGIDIDSLDRDAVVESLHRQRPLDGIAGGDYYTGLKLS